MRPGSSVSSTSRRRAAIPFAIATPVPLAAGVLLAVRALRGHPQYGSRLPQVYVAIYASIYHIASFAVEPGKVYWLCSFHVTGGRLAL